MNEIIEDLLEDMRGGIRRAEHSVYVSLKYTRTVDVIKNLIERFINTMSIAVDILNEYLLEKQKIEEKPQSLIEKINVVQELFSEDELIMKMCDLLLFLRKVTRADYGKCEEFRRHVTMSVKIEGNDEKFDIDRMTEYYHELKEIIKHVEHVAKEIPEEE